MKSFTNEELTTMKEDFIALLKRIKRQNADIDGLIDKLVNSDFFSAPASTKNHSAFEGGLVRHSLNVYNNLNRLVEDKGLNIPQDSILICGLLHDISKMNFYEVAIKNKKVYSKDGSKWDDLGRFDWVSEKGWAAKPVEDRFVYGNHEETSEFMIRYYIPLRVEESVAILCHHGGKGYDSHDSYDKMFGRYKLATLLHLADMLATFVDEKDD